MGTSEEQKGVSVMGAHHQVKEIGNEASEIAVARMNTRLLNH